MKKLLSNTTLLGLDCVNIERLKLAADICQKDFEFGAVKLLSSISDDDSRVILVDPVSSIAEYSRFCLKQMADFINTDFVLIIQYDGFILNPDAWVDEFLKYDYLGAPWWYGDDHNVGNGGFSLRSKRLLDMLKNDKNIKETEHAEDHTICRIYGDYLRKQGIKFAPEAVAKIFSIEGIGKKHDPNANNIWDGQFGFHGLNKTDISKWLALHPEYAGRVINGYKIN